MKERIENLKRLLPRCLLQDQVRLGWQLKRILDLQRNPHGGDGTVRFYPGRATPELLDKLIAKAKLSCQIREWKARNLPQIIYPALPISERREEIIEAIGRNRVLIVVGETGSGKTTQLPKMCLEAGFGIRGKIGCTQPRRVAAMSLSHRLSEELGLEWGRGVGCKIRFADNTRPESYVKMMTDGILLAEIQSDPLLCDYEAVIVDEAHERSLNIDFLLGYLKGLVQKRDDFRLIITSATIDTESFSEAFGGAPVLEVSGRSYPVEVVYCQENSENKEEGKEEEEDQEEDIIDRALQTVEEILVKSTGGDILVFMPSERDIRQMAGMLEGRKYRNLEVLMLFGRQTSADQQRVFSASPRRRVVISTNIAETSLTIPNIHFVVDTGLARISRYSARTRTKRLPIEYISQSSANQRKGRCGRVASGICYRLYSERDFNGFPASTQPEIQRANLAEVILRMKAFRLGEIETFPFINPPTSQSIHAGYTLLQELGALDDERKLTSRGMELARMAVDPSLGRMILQAYEEGVTEEVVIIAAGLSIQDPRERPTEQRTQAESVHREFADPESDFITLLNLWKAYRQAWKELKTENQVRKYCRSHFISFVRMREWNDLYEQLKDILAESGRSKEVSIDRKVKEKTNQLNRRPHREEISGLSQAVRDGIHRSVLSGLLGHIAHKQEKTECAGSANHSKESSQNRSSGGGNLYTAVGNREVMIFPGSVLFTKSASNRSRKKENKSLSESEEKKVQPEWIVAGELVETSRLFVRTVAGIDIGWVEELAPHICRKSYHDAHWEPGKGRVLVLERVMAHGLLVKERWIDYGKVNAAAATDIFIRMALVENGSAGGLEAPLPFLEHNRHLCEKLDLWKIHSGTQVGTDIYEALREFYENRLKGISSIHDLNRVLKEHHKEKDFLFASEKELLGDDFINYREGVFPDQVKVGGYSVEARYAYAPGEENDGVTLKIPLPLLPVIKRQEVDWSVPGFHTARWEQMLEGLPRALRRRLMPIRDRAARLAEVMSKGEPDLEKARLFILKEWEVEIDPRIWENIKLPDYLTPKIEVINEKRRGLLRGADLEELQAKIKKHEEKNDELDWQRVCGEWEKYGLKEWNWDDIPESVTVKVVGGIPLLAFPGLEAEEGEVNLRLFHTPAERARKMRQGVILLAEKMMARELAWIRKDLRSAHGGLLDPETVLNYATLGNEAELEETAYLNLRNMALVPAEPISLNRKYFEDMIFEAKSRIRETLPRFIPLVKEILSLRQQILVYPKQFDWMKKELNMLVYRKFLAYIPFVRVRHLPRYLKMILIRAARAAANPGKDREKSQRVEPRQRELEDLLKRKDVPPEARNKLWNLFWLMQEFKVSCYAQELGTAETVSPARIDEAIKEIKRLSESVK